jgi:hypothetical protein
LTAESKRVYRLIIRIAPIMVMPKGNPNPNRKGLRPPWKPGESGNALGSSKTARMAKGLAREARRLGVDPDSVLRALALLAFSNMQDYLDIDPDGTPRFNLAKVSRDQFAAVQKIAFGKVRGGSRGGARAAVRRTHLKLYDKGRALEILGRAAGLFTDNVRHGVDGNLARVIAERRCREAGLGADSVVKELSAPKGSAAPGAPARSMTPEQRR